MYTFSKTSFSLELLRQKVLKPQSIDEHIVFNILKNNDYIRNNSKLNHLTQIILKNAMLLNLVLESYLTPQYYQTVLGKSQNIAKNYIKSIPMKTGYTNYQNYDYIKPSKLPILALGKKTKKFRPCKKRKPCKTKQKCKPCKKCPSKSKNKIKMKKGGSLHNITLHQYVNVILYIHHTIGALPKELIIKQKGGANNASAAAAASNNSNDFFVVFPEAPELQPQLSQKTHLKFVNVFKKGMNMLSKLKASKKALPEEELFCDFLQQSFNNIMEFMQPDFDLGFQVRRYLFFIQGDIETTDPRYGEGILSENKKIVVKLAPYPNKTASKQILKIQKEMDIPNIDKEKEIKKILDKQEIDYMKLGSYIYEAKIYELMNKYMKESQRNDVLNYHDYTIINIDHISQQRQGVKIAGFADRWTIKEPINVSLKTSEEDALIDININTDEIRLCYCDEWVAENNNQLLCSLIITDAINAEFDTVNNSLNNVKDNFSEENDIKIRNLYTTIFRTLNHYYNNYGFAHWDLHPTNMMCNLESGIIKLYDFDQSMIKYQKNHNEHYSISIVKTLYFTAQNKTDQEIFLEKTFKKISSIIEKNSPQHSLIGNIGHCFDFYRIMNDHDENKKRHRVFCAFLGKQCDDSIANINDEEMEVFTTLKNRKNFFATDLVPRRKINDSLLLIAKNTQYKSLPPNALYKIFKDRYDITKDFFDELLIFTLNNLDDL